MLGRSYFPVDEQVVYDGFYRHRTLGGSNYKKLQTKSRLHRPLKTPQRRQCGAICGLAPVSVYIRLLW